MKTLYVSDLDGTLLNSDSKVNEATIKIINDLIERGMHFTFATARSMYSASIITKDLHLKTPTIIYNGAFLIDPQTHERIYEQSFTQEEAHAILDELLMYEQYPFVYSYINGEECVSYMEEGLHEGGMHYVQSRKGDRRFRKVHSKEAFYEGDIFYITCIESKKCLLPIYEDFKKNDDFRIVFYQELYREEYWLECMPQRVSKAHAIEVLKEREHYDYIVCFGDAVNDIPMFHLCDECYAVEDAVEELKKIATGVIANHNDDAVARWLEEHF